MPAVHTKRRLRWRGVYSAQGMAWSWQLLGGVHIADRPPRSPLAHVLTYPAWCVFLKALITNLTPSPPSSLSLPLPPSPPFSDHLFHLNFAITLFVHDERERAKAQFLEFERLFQVRIVVAVKGECAGVSACARCLCPCSELCACLVPARAQDLDEETKNSDPEVLEQRAALERALG